MPDDHTRLIFAEGKINEALHFAGVAKRWGQAACAIGLVALLLATFAVWRG